MHLTRLLTATAAMAMIAGAASAQTSAAPAAASVKSVPATAGAAPAAARVAAKGDIIETAKASGQFTTFLKAVDATNLTQVLKTNKNLTVFAPTDAAFAAMPPGELDRLMQPANRAELQKLMTYHVINARVDSSKIKGARGPVTTVAGSPVQLDGSGAMLKVNDADIVQADVGPTNGIIHVVDKVLSPSGAATAAATAPASAQAPGAAADASTNTADSAATGSSTEKGM